MLVLSMFMGCTTSKSHIVSMPGTKAASCSPVSAGANPEPSSADAMVPPVATKRIFFMNASPSRMHKTPHRQSTRCRRMAKCLDSKAPRPKRRFAVGVLGVKVYHSRNTALRKEP